MEQIRLAYTGLSADQLEQIESALAGVRLETLAIDDMGALRQALQRDVSAYVIDPSGLTTPLARWVEAAVAANSETAVIIVEPAVGSERTKQEWRWPTSVTEIIGRDQFDRLPVALRRLDELHRLRRDRWNAQQKLRELQDRNQLVEELAGVAVWDYDLENGVVHWNEQVGRLLQMSGHGQGHPFQRRFELVHPDDRVAAQDYFQALLKGATPRTARLRIRRGDGTYGYYAFRGCLGLDRQGRPVHVTGTMTATNDAAKVGHGYPEDAAVLRAFIDHGPMIASIKDREGRYLFLSDRLEQVSNYKRDQMLGRTDVEIPFWSAESAEQLMRVDREVIAYGNARESMVELPDPDTGKARKWLNYKFPIFNSSGHPYLVGGLSVDITHRLALEAECDQFFNMSVDLQCVLDLEGRILKANRAFQKLLGVDPDQACGQALADLMHPDDRMAAKEMAWRLSPEASIDLFEARMRCANGTYLWTSWTLPGVAEGGDTRYAVGRDTTSRKQDEELAQQRQAEMAHLGRLGSMGELAAELAHEINQPLYAIANYSDACRSVIETAPGQRLDELAQWMRKIHEQSQRAAAIVRRVSGFVRKTPPLRGEVDLNEVGQASVALVTVEARRLMVNLRVELAPGIPKIWADRVQIEQVVFNLLRNACEVLAEKVSGARTVTVRSSSQEEYVQIDVCDNGPGFDQETSERLFEPFFTTKKTGMGMGLAISRSIIEAHGGKLWATNCEQGGAEFHLALPIAWAALSPNQQNT